MVDAQTIGVLVTAASVTVAAIYYIMTLRVQQENMRETMRNRNATLTSNLMLWGADVERQKTALELFSMEWKDFDDFYKKYDSSINPDNYAKRMAVWTFYEMLGALYRNGLLDLETVYTISGQYAGCTSLWSRFKPIIEEYRKFDYPKDYFSDFEYLANEMARMRAERDPNWRGAPSHMSSEEYDRVFPKRSPQ